MQLKALVSLFRANLSHGSAFVRQNILLIVISSLCSYAYSDTPSSSDPMIVGYYEQWGIYSPNVHIQDLPLNRLTHLIYQRAGVEESGHVIPGDLFADLQHIYASDDMAEQDYGGSFGKLIQAKKELPNLKTLISIGGYQIEHLRTVAQSEEGRQTFAQSAIEFARKYHFDGIDLNWNYFSDSQKLPDEEKHLPALHFRLLIEALRLAIESEKLEEQSKLLLSATLHSSLLYVAPEELSKASESLNFASVSSGQINMPFAGKTQHISPLYSNYDVGYINSINSWVQKLLEIGIQSQKLVINVSPSAYAWESLNNNGAPKFGLGVSAEKASAGTWDTDDLGNEGIYSRQHLYRLFDIEGYESYWDDRQKMTWLHNPERFQGHFVSYEDKKSIREKLKYVRQHSLAGIGIIALHSDSKANDTLVRIVHQQVEPLKSFKLDFKLWTEKHALTLSLSSTLSLAILIVIILVSRFWTRQKEEEREAKQQFSELRENSQLMEWYLMQLHSLVNKNQYGYFDQPYGFTKQLSLHAKELLSAVTSLLSHTKLGDRDRPTAPSDINLKTIELCMLGVWNDRTPPPTWSWRTDIDYTVKVDPVYLCQVLSGFHDLLHIEHIQTERFEDAEIIVLNLHAGEVPELHPADHWRLKDLFKKAELSGTKIQQIDKTGQHFSLFLSKSKSIENGEWFPNWKENFKTDPSTILSSAENTAVEAESPDLEMQESVTPVSDGVKSSSSEPTDLLTNEIDLDPNEEVNKSTDNQLSSNLTENEIQKTPELDDSKTNKNRSNNSNDEKSLQSARNNVTENRLVTLNSFSQSAINTHDLGELVVKACEFLHIDAEKSLYIAIFQGENLLAEVGEGLETMNASFEHSQGEFRCVISSEQTLSENDLNYFKALMSQVQLVRRTLQHMVSKPLLLSELHRLASDKMRICYLKGEKGYVGVNLFGETEPYYLSLRLKTIKHYFEDDALLQIHRSYLINPDKVIRVVKLGKRKFEIELRGGSGDIIRLPISRNYIKAVQDYQNDWFTIA